MWDINELDDYNLVRTCLSLRERGRADSRNGLAASLREKWALERLRTCPGSCGGVSRWADGRRTTSDWKMVVCHQNDANLPTHEHSGVDSRSKWSQNSRKSLHRSRSRTRAEAQAFKMLKKALPSQWRKCEKINVCFQRQRWRKITIDARFLATIGPFKLHSCPSPFRVARYFLFIMITIYETQTNLLLWALALPWRGSRWKRGARKQGYHGVKNGRKNDAKWKRLGSVENGTGERERDMLPQFARRGGHKSEPGRCIGGMGLPKDEWRKEKRRT